MMWRVGCATVGLIALVAIAIGWLQSPSHITRADAVTVATHSFDAAGVRGAVVDPRPSAGLYEPPSGGPKVPVWKTSAKVKGGTIKLWLTRADAESVFLDDRAPDGASQLLTDTQFRKLADHYENPAVGRKIRRNLLLTVAAALIVLLAVRLAVVVGASFGRGRSRRSRGDVSPPASPESGLDLDAWVLERDWTPVPIKPGRPPRREPMRADKATS